MRVLEEKTGQYPEEERQTKIGLAWAGFFFSSHVDFVKDEALWLFNTYQHEKAVGLPIYLRTSETGYIEIPYGDLNRLVAVVDTIKAFREQKAAVTA
jgi:CRISPR/Cas system-associated exonuclease Cas4 (RecB family)